MSSSSEGQEAFLCIPLANMFPNDEMDDDQVSNDAYLENVIVFETDDIMEIHEEVFADDIDPPKMMRPASKTAIEGLEKVKIDERLVSCSVCFEDISIGTEARRLPCSHVYHTGCIVNWLQESNKCPLCRYKMAVVDFNLNFPMPVLDSDVD